ncbi:MFS transporter [Enterococcus faecalis]
MSSVIAPALTGKISDTTGSKVMGFYIAVVILLIGTILFMLVNLKKRGADSSNK